mmetsp:Transcript_7778/g.11894  ORF Transcript_7778/g.11894 Transcript_7778/m.11894 type:complete len:1144 (-) Transcript_7778:373-3804(-)
MCKLKCERRKQFQVSSMVGHLIPPMFVLAFIVLTTQASASNITECIFQLGEAIGNNDGKINETEFAMAVNSMSSHSLSSSDFSSYVSLPEELKLLFSHSSCLCDDKKNIEKSCCSGNDTAAPNQTMGQIICFQIDLALNSPSNTNPQLISNFSQDANTLLPINIETGFVISNSVGITASDMVVDFDAFDDLRFSFDILAEEVVKYVNDSSVRFFLDSAALEEIYDMKCPEQGTDFCQSVFATFTVQLSGSMYDISSVQTTYGQYMQAFIDLGLLNDSLRLSVAPDLPVLYVLNGTIPLRPTIVPSTPQVESLMPSTQPPQEVLVLNQFIVRTEEGFTSMAFGDKNYMNLEESYKSFLTKIYQNVSVVQYFVGTLDAILDVDCSDEDEFLAVSGTSCHLITANHTVKLGKAVIEIETVSNILEEVTSSAITEGFLELALTAHNSTSPLHVGSIPGTTIGLNIGTIETTFIIANEKNISAQMLQENEILYTTLVFVYNAMGSMIVRDSNEVNVRYKPFSTFLRLEDVACPEDLYYPWLCQKVDSSYEIKFMNLFLDQDELQRDLLASTKSAIISGYLEKLLHLFDMNRTLFVRNHDSNIISIPPTPAQMPIFSTPPLGISIVEITTPFIASSQFSLRPEDISATSSFRTNLSVALTNVATSVISLAKLAGTVVGPSISPVFFVQGSYQVGRISETPCPENNTTDDHFCYLVSSSYSMQIDTSEVNEEPIKHAYTTATQNAIQEGTLLEALSKIDPNFPFLVVDSIDPKEFTLLPTTSPTYDPTYYPTLLNIPSAVPSLTLSSTPSRKPSLFPTISHRPSSTPSQSPSLIPSMMPSISLKPTLEPSNFPTLSIMPSSKPSDQPSHSSFPSQTPSFRIKVAAKASGVSAGGIVGIVLGVLFLFGLCGVAGYFGWKRLTREEQVEKGNIEDGNVEGSLHGGDSKATNRVVSQDGDYDEDVESYYDESYSSMEDDYDTFTKDEETANTVARKDSAEATSKYDKTESERHSTNASNKPFSSFRNSLLNLSRSNGEEMGKATPSVKENVESDKSGFLSFFRKSSSQEKVKGKCNNGDESIDRSTHHSNNSSKSFSDESTSDYDKSETDERPAKAAGSVPTKSSTQVKRYEESSSYDTDSSDFDSMDSYSTM